MALKVRADGSGATAYTETNSEDTVVCERARNILAGYDVGERITPELAAKYKNIVSSKYLYYNRSDEEYYEYDFPSLIALPDISHVDETNLCNEYWLDDNKSAAVRKMLILQARMMVLPMPTLWLYRKSC